MNKKRPASWYRPGPGCRCIRGQSRKQHAGGTAVCWTAESEAQLIEARARIQREREKEDVQEERKKRLKHFRVSWTEEYCQVREAEDAQEAEENRDDDGAFIGCTEISSQEVRPCAHCKGRGCGRARCESGWVPVVSEKA